MNSLTKQLRHLISFHGGPNTNVELAVADIEAAITKANYVPFKSYYFGADSEGRVTVYTDAKMPVSEAIWRTAEYIATLKAPVEK